MIQNTFKRHLLENNAEGSGKAASYLRALDLLQVMLEKEDFGFGDCREIWSVTSPTRLCELYEFVKLEAKKGADTPWHLPESSSYLQKGYCSAALKEFITHVIQSAHEADLLSRFESHAGDEAALSDLLNHEAKIPKLLADELQGKDAVRAVKQRINQQVFRKIILKNYRYTCCITGLAIPDINRASHIIGWAERTDTRMDPRNGLCLSATYDAAFDRKLITLDEDYRIVLSQHLREFVHSESYRQYFGSVEGRVITLPQRYRPLQEYLAEHRKRCVA